MVDGAFVVNNRMAAYGARPKSKRPTGDASERRVVAATDSRALHRCTREWLS